MATDMTDAISLLAEYEILDTRPEQAFDDLARRAAEALVAPMAGISFFDPNSGGEWREWFKARIGFPATSLPREQCFFLPVLQSALPHRRSFIVGDTLADKRFRDHPLVAGPPYLCFYAAAAIVARGETIGALAVFDTVSREVSPRELEVLVNLAGLVSARLEARAEARRERRAKQSSEYIDFSEPAEQRIQQLTDEFLQLEQLLEDEIATRQAAQDKLRHEKEFSDAAIASLPGSFYMFDANGRMVRWNSNFAGTTGYTSEEIAARRALDFIADKDRAIVADAIRRIFEQGEEISLEAEMKSRDGHSTPYTFHGRALDISGQRYCIGVGRDISERKRAEIEIRAAKERLDLALAGSNLAMWDWDLVSNIVYFNESWSRLLNAKPAESKFRGEEVLAWTHADDTEKFRSALLHAIKGENNDFDCEYRIPDEVGDWIWIQSRGKVTERDAVTGRARRMTGTSANITKRKAAEERAEFLATRDPLTGLPNRMLVNDRLEQGIANAARKRSRLAFMFIDLDRFKTINDSLGHDVGDELLKRVAARLSACVRASDTVARLGGDEFAVILENLPDDAHEGAQSVAEKMISSLAAPIMINGQHLNTSCSIGIGVFPMDGLDSQSLMKHADVAMYDAKAKGRNNYQFFSHEMNARAQERLSIENFLRLALRRNELLLYYQPRVAFATGEITGVEALIRWQHPRRGLLSPDKFIGVAEDSGLIVPIGEWVIETAFAQIVEWQKKSGRELGLAVNVSPGQIFDGERLIRAIATAAQATGLDPKLVELELTESMLLKNIDETAALLRKLGELGIGLAIDDFGTGYSSLSYLKQLPVDSIKVDSSFVRDIGTDPNDEAIIRAIIAMTHSLKLNVIAEGVEREEQYRVLRDLECDEYQGFFFSRPLPPAEFEAQFLDT
jgi:diguanylate cyclase (GGDEF)-like protein/PAS domain S-box-containing protein